MTEKAPPAIALVTSPEYLIPPSAMIGTPSVSGQITRCLDMTGGILDHHIQLPFLSTSIHTYIIIVTAMLIGVIWHYHDDHIQIG